MIHGLGTDIVRLSRIVGIVERRGIDAFAKKILSTEELPYFHATAHTKALRVRFLAVRWAVKEAAYKALYPTLKPTWGDLTFHPLHALHTGSKPQLVLRKEDAGEFGELHSSVSHDGDYVLASVIAMKKPS